MPQATPSTPSQMLLNKSSFPDNTLNNGDTVTSADGAVTATFSNVVSFDGMMAGGVADVEGLFLGEFGNEIDQFDITFNVDTRITSYTIGSTTTFGSGYLFRLSGAGAVTGDNAMTSVGTFTFDMGAISFFQANQAYTFTHDLVGDFVNFKDFYVIPN